MLAEVLADEGYLAFPVSSAVDAERLIRSVQPDVVILDVHLAGDAFGRASGWQLLNGLMVDPQTRHIPVVLTTGAAKVIEARRPALLSRHGVRVLLKPFDIDDLLAARTLQKSDLIGYHRGNVRVLDREQLE